MPEVQYILGDARQLPLADQSVNVAIASPPYTMRRDYGINACMGMEQWIDFMIHCTREGLRVSRGPVLWVVNSCIFQKSYMPAVEGLMYQAVKAGLVLEHPLIWLKNAAPTKRDWWMNTVEHIIAFRHADMRPIYFNWEAIATPQKCKTGGRFRQRAVNGERRLAKAYVRNKLARPYNVIRANVGGGLMGDPLATENEAPYPESLISPLVLALTTQGQIVLDQFSGGGTTAAVCLKLGRNAVNVDIRQNQIDLAMRRHAGIQMPLDNAEKLHGTSTPRDNQLPSTPGFAGAAEHQDRP